MTTPTPVSIAAPSDATPARRLGHARAFVAIAAVFVLFMAASSAPSPLYVVYQQLWQFSATTLTLIFAVYVVGLVASLLTLGALSDHIGRRPVLAAAIALEAISLALFAVAGDVGVLLVARVLQGIATGAAMTTLGAALIDLNPPHAPRRAGVVNGVAPLAGLAIGALGCGALVQYGPAPTHLVYELLLGGMVLAAVAVAILPETSARRPGARHSLIPRLGVPPLIRSHLIALVPILLASWALVGLYLSLGPSIASGLLGLRSHLIGGLVVTLFCGTGALTAFAFRAADPRPVQLWSPALLTVGTAISLVGVQTGTVWAAVAGTVVAGLGFGGSALTSFSTLVRLAAPEQRGELLAVALVISYVAFSVPAVIAGLASTAYGLHPTAVVYAGVVIGFSALALVARIIRGRRERRD
ncbi:MFS transporter [Nakamurella deserti]|uniref:MFS transporter n=1 Tax=Nakamurella deserti TaxID=2164074 RepID=UPI000DBE176B|nr:MFS transporter [Nakamurella deserti]